ncbi:FMN-binding protein [Romboutsia sp.]|uniref:FMN-binding protein n=1 Tax=Romboutsia sp. TaxID=1965302 RepID=UPI002CF22FB6|nr:FMN-binding protein [Romboutsia sp.]HSQ88761.1 FMN-binding protein [Romboutsia sp.]
MKNSKNKVIALIVCGIIVGSIGTSFIGNFEANNQQQVDSNVESDSTTESSEISNGKYKNGTYQGTASGYAEDLNVEVKVSNGEISKIDIVSHNETPGFYEKAFELVPSEIIKKQSTNVDAASGATYSSQGIINAVNDALKEAENKEYISENENLNVSDSKYKDGTYQGSASGYAEDLNVEVKVSNGEILKIDIVSHNETPKFFEKALELVPSEIIKKQSTNVDVASGATYSSEGIMKAVDNALKEAENKEYTTTNEDSNASNK